MIKFTHLHTHSHYSLLDGLAKIDDLISRAKEFKMDSLAVTDHGVLYGAVEFYKKAKKAGIKPILGVEAYLALKSRFNREPGERYCHLILLAENVAGWRNLVKLVSKASLEGFYYKPRVDKELLREHHEGLIALSACLGGEVNRHLLNGRYEEAKAAALEYVQIFGKDNFFLEIGDHPNIPEVVKIRSEIIKLAKETNLPLVATQDIHYAKAEDAEYHDILLAVQTGSQLSDDDRLTLKADNFSLTSGEEMAERFKDIPESISNTQIIADRCNVELELGKIYLPHFKKPDGKDAMEYMRELINERLPLRYPADIQTAELKERLEMELRVIEKTGFGDYFLIVQDFISWAKQRGIAVGPGRGSAAGSLVSYVLGITDIDPLTYGLLFERFLNPDRIQMPDIDLDFADTRRDEVLAYIREKYGEDHVAQIITFGTMAARAAVRDAGRAMGLTYSFCDQIAKLIAFNMNLRDAIEKVPELAEFYEKNEDAKKLLDAASHLEGVARHASVHACGTVITEKPLTEYVPLQLAPQDKNSIITQFEMHSIEDLGLLKIDLLGLKNLTIIEETLRLIQDRQGIEVKISELPLNDEKTFKILQEGHTTGVFQFESSGMRRYMKDIHPTELEDLIALVALYRPGPMELIPSYINRKHGREKIIYLHPQLEPILKNTYGIGVYQEQMMQIARNLAGYTLAEADTLRKAIGKKIKSLLDEQKEKLMNGMIKSKIDPKTAAKIWDLFPPFARYGFNRSHAACYALIGYRTAYLKAHFPEEFSASLLNAEVHDIDRISFLIGELKKAKIEILPPDINESFVSFTPTPISAEKITNLKSEADREIDVNADSEELVRGQASTSQIQAEKTDGEKRKIRFGLQAIKNVGEAITQAIIEERVRGGTFASFADFLSRIQHKDLNKKSLESLIKSGAFDSLGVERGQALFNIDEILRFSTIAKKSSTQNNHSLFGAASGIGATLKLKEATPATTQEKLSWEKELLGFYLSDHPLNSFVERIKKTQAKPIGEAKQMKDENKIFRVAGLVSKIQKVITKNGQPMVFAKVEDLSAQSIEVVVFNSILNKTANVWEQNKVILVQGKISLRGEEPKMICDAAMVLEA